MIILDYENLVYISSYIYVYKFIYIHIYMFVYLFIQFNVDLYALASRQALKSLQHYF